MWAKTDWKTSVKTIVTVIISVFFFFWSIGNATSSSSKGDTPTNPSTVYTNTSSNSTTSSEVSAETNGKQEGDIKNGKFNVKIKDSKVVKNDGDDILIVTYAFTNNSKESQSFMYSIDDKLFQNGVELGDVFGSWGIEDDYDFDNHSKEIKSGVTLDVQVAYELNDTTTDVEVELCEWLFDDDPVTYTIKLSK